MLQGKKKRKTKRMAQDSWRRGEGQRSSDNKRGVVGAGRPLIGTGRGRRGGSGPEPRRSREIKWLERRIISPVTLSSHYIYIPPSLTCAARSRLTKPFSRCHFLRDLGPWSRAGTSRSTGCTVQTRVCVSACVTMTCCSVLGTDIQTQQ